MPGFLKPYANKIPTFFLSYNQEVLREYHNIHLLEPYMGQLTGSKLRKEYDKAVYLSPCLFNLYAEHIMRNAGLEETQAGIKIAGRNRGLQNHCRW